MEVRLRLVDFSNGPYLWTRRKARDIRARLSEILDGLKPGDILVVDAAGIEVFDYSFANELFGKTLLSIPREYPGRFVIVEHLMEDARENLTKALESLGLVIIEREGDKLRLLGKVHPADIDTFDRIVQAAESVTAAVLKDQLGIGITAVNERLTKLVNLGLIRRELGVSSAGRAQYVYRGPA